jgi:beta-glucanase (GH16 family)
VIFLAILAVAGAAPPPASADWRLVWSDEFDRSGIDKSKWTQDEDCWGGGNDERQCYTRSPRNSAVVNGSLAITARQERVTGPALPKHLRPTSATAAAKATRQFSSARLSTRGKAAWRYGKFEVRARLPQGQGTWPAIWMLPENENYGPWAASGEIDILEAVNLGTPCAKCATGREDTILGTLHFGGRWPGNRHKGEEVSFPAVLDGKFHTYALEWHPGRIVWQFDGQTFAERTASEWSTSGSSRRGAPFDQSFYLVLNLAIGGKLAESRGIGGVHLDGFPKTLEVDWVRVWQRPPGADNPSPKTGN